MARSLLSEKIRLILSFMRLFVLDLTKCRRIRDGRTNGQDMHCGLLGRPHIR